MSILFGIQLAHMLGLSKVLLESDANNAVLAIRNKYAGYSPIHLVYDDISNLSSSFDCFSITHVRRADNTLAHLVARWNSRGCNEYVCLGMFPPCLMTLALGRS